MHNPQVHIYIQNANRKEWLKLQNNQKGAFVNWCIKEGLIDKFLSITNIQEDFKEKK